ncbi:MULTISPECIES: acyl-CoA dehydrogenase family protein [Amycolatopsis]|uniref:Acyl-CoA dehydrogenase n=2 Tax=Amycolatopsis TaxID=1813 RepID=A0A1I3L4P7_9PSEU|nr:acyl-CoA dehydrogenase family protein [Amycolatopsis sacchari]SFI79649.1 Acyl-CoA dehydrogenase [Amycolatopsis sacchari]
MIDDSPKDETSEILRAHAEKAEQYDRPATESLGALRKDGVFALRTPRAYGGEWAGAETIGRRLAGLGRACPSTAWIAGACVTAKNLVVGSFPGSRSDEFFADPDALFCGSGVPAGQGVRVAEGVRITGRWPNVSGCEDAAWAVLALAVEGTLSFTVVPVADLTVDRTWHMAGMRGTGSHSLVADDLLVPARRVAAASAFAAQDLLLYSITVLGPVVGAARGALDATAAMFASDRKPFMSTYSRMGESPGARHWLAEAAHLVNRAENTMLTVARAAESAGLSGAASARLHMELADAGRDCRSAVERMLDLHGASGFATGNVLQRYWRDVAVGSRHPHLNPYLAVERFGTALVSPENTD